MKNNRGITIVELLLVIGALGVTFSMGFSAVSSISNNAKENKLISEVATLNSAVSVYLAMGGDLDGIEDPEKVFRRLRAVTSEEVSRKMPGVVGSVIDPQFSFRKQDEVEAGGDDSRVYWVIEKQRFRIANVGQLGGIAEFFIDPELDQDDVDYVERSFVNSYATESSWVWDFEEKPATVEQGPTSVATVGSGLTGVDNSPTATNETEPVIEVTEPLDPPLFSIESGTYSIRAYQVELVLSNPNVENVSDIYYQTNFGSWQKYTGVSILVGPDDTVAAQTVALLPAYEDSRSVIHEYYASPVKLNNPEITVSAGRFGLVWRDQSISVELENTNGEDPHEMVYRLNEGDWTNYDETFFVERDDYPDGVKIEARAISTAAYYLDSEIETKEILPAVLTLTIDADIDSSIGDTDLYAHIDFLNGNNNNLYWTGLNDPDSDTTGKWVDFEDGTLSFDLSVQGLLDTVLGSVFHLLSGNPDLSVGLDLQIILDVNGNVYNSGLGFEIDLFDGESILSLPVAELTLLNHVLLSSALMLDEDQFEFSVDLLNMMDDTLIDTVIEDAEHGDEVDDALNNSF